MNINATLIGQTVAFIIFVWFCMKFVWPPLMNAIEARQKRIADGLADADRAAKDLELAQAKATDQLKDAKLQPTKSLSLPTSARLRLLTKPKLKQTLSVRKSLLRVKQKLKLNVIA